MTYNFDPDRWYDGEYYLLEQALKQGRITRAEFDGKVAALSDKYDDIFVLNSIFGNVGFFHCPGAHHIVK